MKKHLVFKANAIFWGVAFIAIGLMAILCASGIIPGSIYLVLMTALFAAIFIRSLIGFHFVPLFISAGHLVYLYSDIFGLPEKLHNWMLIMASLIIGIGFELIFGNLKKSIKKKIKAKYEPDSNVKTIGNDFGNTSGASSETVVGSNFHIENGFGEQTRYVRGSEISNGHIENGFGGLTVYFENVTLMNNQANLSLENGFGRMNVYMPASWSVAMTEDNGMGQITRHGEPSLDPDAPRVNLHVENGMGKVDIYFT